MAQSVVTKPDTIDAHTATITAQAKAITELTATDAILVAVFATKSPRTVTSPPGFTAQETWTVTTMEHAVNTAGGVCPPKKHKWGNIVFVVPQHFSISGKKDQDHIPTNCPKAPQNTALKAKVQAKWTAERAVRTAQKAATN